MWLDWLLAWEGDLATAQAFPSRLLPLTLPKSYKVSAGGTNGYHGLQVRWASKVQIGKCPLGPTVILIHSSQRVVWGTNDFLQSFVDSFLKSHLPKKVWSTTKDCGLWSHGDLTQIWPWFNWVQNYLICLPQAPQMSNADTKISYRVYTTSVWQSTVVWCLPGEATSISRNFAKRLSASRPVADVSSQESIST